MHIRLESGRKLLAQVPNSRCWASALAIIMPVLLGLGFVFLYAPILSLVVYSFNESRLVTVWCGFSLKWYGKLLDSLMMRGMGTIWIARTTFITAFVTVVVASRLTEMDRGCRGGRVLCLVGLGARRAKATRRDARAELTYHRAVSPITRRETSMPRKVNAPAMLASLLAAVLALPAQAEEDEGWWFGGGLAATSDYVFRGVSQTDEDPAIQGNLDFGHSSGFYAGVWASNVDFAAPDGIDVEVNLYAGWVFGLVDEASLDLYWIRYIYPGANAGFGINYDEYVAALSLLDYYTATVAWANDYLRTDEGALYYHLGAEFPLPVAELNLKLGFGYNDISKAAGSDYRDFQVGINRSWGAYKADLSYFDTSGFDSDVQALLGPDKWADGRVVLTLSYEF